MKEIMYRCETPIYLASRGHSQSKIGYAWNLYWHDGLRIHLGPLSERAARELILFICIYVFVGATLSLAQCPVLYVMVKGQVERPPRSGVVRVQLVYSKHSRDQNGESGEVKLEDGSFRMQIPFLTQSSSLVLGFGRSKCDLRPKTVVVTLVADDREYDRVSLDFVKDFKMADSSAYALRSEIVLHGVP